MSQRRRCFSKAAERGIRISQALQSIQFGLDSAKGKRPNPEEQGGPGNRRLPIRLVDVLRWELYWSSGEPESLGVRRQAFSSTLSLPNVASAL